MVVKSSGRGILELSVNQVPPSQCGDDLLAFCTSLVRRMGAFIAGAPCADQPDDCVLCYDNASVHAQAVDDLLPMNSVRRMPLPPYCPHLSAINPAFADYNCFVRTLAFRNPELPDRSLHVLAFASVPLASIQGRYREARRQAMRALPEMTDPGAPLHGVFAPLPVVEGPT